MKCQNLCFVEKKKRVISLLSAKYEVKINLSSDFYKSHCYKCSVQGFNRQVAKTLIGLCMPQRCLLACHS